METRFVWIERVLTEENDSRVLIFIFKILSQIKKMLGKNKTKCKDVRRGNMLLELQRPTPAKVDGPRSPITNLRMDDISDTAHLPDVAYFLVAEVC